MPLIFTDTTTIKPDGSGTARYAKELSDELHNRSSLVVADRTWSPARSTTEALSPHRALNAEWIANRTNIKADAAIFPNYFMPLGWPYPSAVTIHDVSFLSHPQFYSPEMRLYYKTRIKHTLRRADLILTVSQASKTAIVKYLDVNPESILVHPPSAPLKPVNPIPQAEQPYLLYVGNLEPKKNILKLIQSFNLIGENSGYRLILTGKFHGSKRWNRMIRNLIDSSPTVVWDGYVTDQKLKDYLSYASGLLLVSHVEGFGLPVMDALSMNIPVLTSSDPALREVAGEFGLIAEANHTESIAEGIEKLISKKECINACSEIQNRYGPDAYKEGITQITDRLIKPKQFYFPSNLMEDTFVGHGDKMKKAILGSIAYASVFNTGIHADKLFHALSFPVTKRSNFRNALPGLLNSQKSVLNIKNEIIQITAFQSYEQMDSPESAAIESKRVRKRHYKIIRTLLGIPFIKGIYYSGGTVHGSGLGDKTDLDLLVIAKKDCVWITYALIRIISWLFGKSESVCANYIIDEKRQEVGWQRDYYTAFQLLFLKKIALKPKVNHIRAENSWVKKYFPNHPAFPPPVSEKISSHFSFFSIINLSIMFIWSRMWISRGLKSGSGGLLWDAHRIKLHTNDHRPRVSARFKKITEHLFSIPPTSQKTAREREKM